MFLRATAWREIAEHTADTLTKGMRVVATGRLVQHNWQTPEGENRSMLGLDLDDIGPSLRFATAKVTKTQRTGQPNTAEATDPWTTAGPAPAAAAPAGAGFTADPPF
ncbi:single-stranded DNA-binding protein [Kitasatospora paranensis]|uniref:single-stranded DNA-binding protein n=1 Tax=Kitasatospora paranensis TaxID=258053 RepID=UPI0031EE9AC2